MTIADWSVFSFGSILLNLFLGSVSLGSRIAILSVYGRNRGKRFGRWRERSRRDEMVEAISAPLQKQS